LNPGEVISELHEHTYFDIHKFFLPSLRRKKVQIFFKAQFSQFFPGRIISFLIPISHFIIRFKHIPAASMTPAVRSCIVLTREALPSIAKNQFEAFFLKVDC